MSEIQYPTQLDKIIDTCRKKGVEFLKIGDFEIRLREEAPPSNYKRKKLESVSTDKPEQTMTEEDYLLWSVPQDEVADG